MKRNIHQVLLYNSKLPNISYNITLPTITQGLLKSTLQQKLICYYNLPTDSESLQVRDIDPFLCTHINAAFADVLNGSLYLNQSYLEALQQLVQLKSVNKQLKILISVGGAGNQNGFPEMVFNHTNRKRLVTVSDSKLYLFSQPFIFALNQQAPI